ncbi:MAG TPA: bifunctional 5,6,7,8-tetrahydromethanopterin hydro-lyase/3-hexulose-6-phosphate synthase, partial [Candidatus Lokiarchaeia archaeon]|nr:bifunctional 5,6,7,8-tetrahydromethanopterin hydro-lyase/3-hexulose-6-phosphate synthase [Candidatus Lokiarchaeia archaeon]
MPKSVDSKPDFFIGEALLGEGDELAHLDVMIGDRNGPVGTAFATGLVSLSKGHTPLLAVIRPNLIPKPQAIIVPKVTIGDLDDANKIFGPAQAAVAKAIADCLEEGIIPLDKADEWVCIVSVFIHPNAKDYRRIYQYNYGATRLAIARAIKRYPPLNKLWFDKDRAKHPVAGIRVSRLWRPPYIQVALDNPEWGGHKKMLEQLPKSDRVIIEAGTPLVKRYGIDICKSIREVIPDAFIVADLKTLDVGKLEVDFAFNSTADAVVVSGLSSNETVNKFLVECQRMGMYAVVDFMEVEDPITKLQGLKEIPDIVLIHRGIDTEETKKDPSLRWALIPQVKELYADKAYVSGKPRVLVAVAGGLNNESAALALKMGADILIVGRYITSAKDPERALRNLLNVIPGSSDIDLSRVHSDDDDTDSA